MPPLADRSLDLIDHGFVVTGLPHQFAGGFGMELVEPGAPGVIALLGHRVAVCAAPSSA
jgi:hypothetical protein